MGVYLILVCTVVVAVYIYLILSASTMEKFEWIIHVNFAHRGYHCNEQLVPENSMMAFVGAKEKGYGIELDVQMTSDGQIVVFHDDELGRMCGSSELLVRKSWQELQCMRLLGTNQNIPLLSEVLKEVEGKVPLYIEIKYLKNDCDALCSAVLAVLSKYPGNFAVASFNPYVLAYFKRNAPSIMRIQIAQECRHTNLPWWQKFVLENLLVNVVSRPHGISFQYDKTNVTFRVCKWLGAYTLGWTIKSPKQYEMFHSLFDSVVFEQFEAELKNYRV